MSLQNQVTTVFRADTAPYIAAVKNMRGVEQAEAKRTLADLDQQNAKLTDQLAVLAKGAAAIGAVTIAWKAAQAAASAHLEDLRLESAAAGANIDRLRDATRGLVETDNLLAFAGKSMHGVWKLNQAEMEIVAKGTRVLAKDLGIDLQTAMEGVTEAVTKGSTRALKELGIEVKDKTGLIKEMTEASKRWGDAGTDSGEDWQRALVAMRDVWDDIQGAIGELVVALAPLVHLIAALAAKIREISDTMGGPMVLAKFFMGGGLAGAFVPNLPAGSGPGGRRLIASGGGATADFSLSGLHANDSRLMTGMRELYESGLLAVGDAWSSAGKRVRGGAGRGPLEFQSGFSQGLSLQLRPDDTVTGLGGDLGGAGAIDTEAIRELTDALKPTMEIAAEPGPTLLERIFGKPDEIGATVVAIQAATSAVDMFAQAGGAAMGAWITGEQSMAAAIKETLANALKSIAMQSTIEALKHTAYGIGALAFGPIMGGSAAMHFKAAAMHGAVALAAGAGAKAAHNAGWAGGGPSSVGAGGNLGGRGGGYGGDEQRGERTVVVALGRDFGMLTDLEQRQMLNQAVRIGQAEGGGTNHVRFR